MSNELNTQESLEELRRQLTEAAEQETLIKDLNQQVDAATEKRAAAMAAAHEILEGFVEVQDKIFTNLSELMGSMHVHPEKPKASSKKKSGKKASPKKAKRKAATKRTPPTRSKKALGYPDVLDSTISLSPRESEIVDIMKSRWPLFTTPEYFVRKGLIPQKNHITAKVNQIRKKGVPIESARQARESDTTVTTKDRGYRLIVSKG